MLVEDDAVCGRLLSLALEHAGFHVGWATTGHEALAMLEAESWDAVVTDWMLPGLSGTDLVVKQRAMGSNAFIAISSALGGESAASRSLEAGADEFLTKPVDLKTLPSLLRTGIGRRQAAAAETLTGPDVSGPDAMTERHSSVSTTRWVGDYELMRKTAQDELREVWEGRGRNGRAVDVRMLRVDFTKRDPEQRKQFLKEASAVRQLRDPRVLEIIDVGLHPQSKQPFFVTEKVPGCPLADVEATGAAMSLGAIVAIAQDVCSALEALHAAGFVHRDVTPANVAVYRDGQGSTRAKLMDLRHRIRPAAALGTPELIELSPGLGETFAAPERLYGQGRMDYRADIWSAGSVIKELLEHRCRAGASTAEWGDALAIVRRATHWETEARWRSAKDLGDAFALVAHEAPASLRRSERSSGEPRLHRLLVGAGLALTLFGTIFGGAYFASTRVSGALTPGSPQTVLGNAAGGLPAP
jgi:DNA-binding response OmpR family regulator